MAITTEELQQNLSKYIIMAENEQILITANGKVVAMLSNPNQDRIETAKSLFGILPDDIIISSGILVAIVTAYCGPIMFIGLAVPHLARAIFRSSDHRILMPATALCGALLALVCNFIARMPGFEGALPVNSVTALVGAPVIAAVIFGRRKNEVGE